MTYAIDPRPIPSLPILGMEQRFPIFRVFCVGRNFADHAAEMGAEVDREAPFYFTKSGHHVATAEGIVPMATRTHSYHHEVELVVALGKGGKDMGAAYALDHIYAYSVGLDMTRRDLQAAAKDKRRPWDTAKDVEASALVAPLCPTGTHGHCSEGAIQLSVNGDLRQNGNLSQMIWSVPEIIADLSELYTLQAGDLIFMGTPAGVGPVLPGDRLQGSIEGLTAFDLTFG